MPLSISSSDAPSSEAPRVWRRFFALAVGSGLAAAAIIYAFVAIVDPFDTLPLSPPLHRAPVSTNARFSFPALARSQRFDSAVIGTSTSRLLRPVVLNEAFDARFVNLAMNAATAYEQTRMLDLFAQNHPDAKAVILGLDIAWCGVGEVQRYTPRPFPEWMYGGNRWAGYRQLFNLYALTEAGKQFAHVTGWKRSRYGLDGYTRFVPDDSQYDRARVAQHLRQDAANLGSAEIGGAPETWHFASLAALPEALARLPVPARKVLYFAPYNHVLDRPGSSLSRLWDACKRRTAEIAATIPNAVIADFMIPSPITLDDDNYWDALHYRVAVADRIARDLAAASRGEASTAGDYRLLLPPVED